MPVLEQKFNNISEVVSFSALPLANEKNKESFERLDRNFKNSDRYYGVSGGIAGLKRIMSNGWPEGVEKMEQAFRQIKADIQPRSIRRRKVWTDQGDELDINRVYNGDLDHAWQTTQRKQAAGGTQHITLLSFLGANYKTTAEQMFWRGAAILKLADILGEAGYSVEIIGQSYAEDIDITGKWECKQSVIIKQADMPLSKNSLAVSLCCGGFYRYYMLRGYGACPNKISGHFGTSKNDKNVPWLCDEQGKLQPGIIRAPGHLFSQEDAENWLNEVLKAFSD